QLVVTNAANLNGTLLICTSNGFTPSNGDSVVILQAGSLVGTFDAIVGPPGLPAAIPQYDATNGTVTVQFYSDPFFEEHFSTAAIPPLLVQSASNTPAVLNGTNAVFPGVGDTGRSYLKTFFSDYASTGFAAEITVTLNNQGGPGIGFFGLGVGEPLAGFFHSPRVGSHVFARVMPTDFFGGGMDLVDNGTELGTFTDIDTGNGTHRIRLNYDSTAQTLRAVIDKDYDGGPFIPTTFLPDLADTSNNGFNATNARIFFGGATNVTFDDLSIRPFAFDLLWTGGVSTTFGTAANWKPASSPTEAANVYFDDTAATTTVDLTAAGAVRSATFFGSRPYVLTNSTLSLFAGTINAVGGTNHTIHSDLLLETHGTMVVYTNTVLTLNGAIGQSAAASLT
ncbi:MAG: hypothetical protein AAF570_27100, partial [Bacteroidota bacterium]